METSLLSVIEADTEINSIELATIVNSKFLYTNNGLPPLSPLVNDPHQGKAEEIALKYNIYPEEAFKQLTTRI